MNKYLEKIAELHDSYVPEGAPMGMTREGYGNLSGGVNAVSGGLLGATLPNIYLLKKHNQQVDKAMPHVEEAIRERVKAVKNFKKAREARTDFYRNVPKAKGRALVPYTPGVGEYIAKGDDAARHLNAAFSAEDRVAAAKGTAAKHMGRAKLIRKAMLPVAIAGLAGGGYLGFKGGKYFGQKEWDYKTGYHDTTP